MKLTQLAVMCIAVVGIGCTPPPNRPTATKTSEGEATSGPAGSVAAAKGSALVRFVNAEPTIDKADLLFADQIVFKNISYKTVTAFQEVPDNRRDFHLRGTGMTNDLATNNEALKGGRHHTIVAMRKPDNTPVLKAFDDSLESPTSGKARLRFINAATNEGKLSLSLAGNNRPLFSGVEFGTGGGYQEAAPGAAVIEVRSEDRKTGGMRVRNQTIEAGKTYTIIALGDGKQDLMLIEDQYLEKAAGVK